MFELWIIANGCAASWRTCRPFGARGSQTRRSALRRQPRSIRPEICRGQRAALRHPPSAARLLSCVSSRASVVHLSRGCPDASRLPITCSRPDFSSEFSAGALFSVRRGWRTLARLGGCYVDVDCRRILGLRRYEPMAIRTGSDRRPRTIISNHNKMKRGHRSRRLGRHLCADPSDPPKCRGQRARERAFAPGACAIHQRN